jgi:hypothetical protein
MRHYPIDNSFFEELPEALKPHFDLWAAQQPK